MSALTVAQVVASCRALVGDTGTSRDQFVRDERPQGDKDGVNQRFKTLYYPIPDLTRVKLFQNGTAVVQAAAYPPATGEFFLDASTGQLTMGTPPAGTPQDLLEISYPYTWYTDNDYHEFIAQSGRYVGAVGVGATPALVAASAVSKTLDDLMDSLMLFVGYTFNKRRADDYAYRFSSSAGGQSSQVQTVAGEFRALAQEMWDEAVKMRDDYYKRRGAREAPAFGISNYTGAGKDFTPRR